MAAGAAPAKPVAIVDIGSNSVRLVAYERLSRSPTPIFNEKVLCGLGRGVATTGLLGADAMDRALAALRNFKVLCRNLGVGELRVLATAAARDARNGSAFLDAASAALGADIELIGGPREAELSALGVSSGFHGADGVVGDMGGGSLELVDVRGATVGRGVSLPLGGLALLDASRGSPKRAARIARDALLKAQPIRVLEGRTFYAVGGTWRALAKLHMRARNYPLNVMHGYAMPAAEALGLGPLAERIDADDLAALAAVASARRPLLAYGAAVLEEVVRLGRPREVVISASGVREGLLFEALDRGTRAEDPLFAAAREINDRHARDPGHGPDLCAWTDRFYAAAGLPETADETRLRHAACLMADIAWRAHPDHRGDHALSAIANGAFSGVDHPGRAFLALTVAYRHGGEVEAGVGLRALLTPGRLERARLLGAVLRVAYLVSAAMGGVLPRTALRCSKARVTLALPADFADLASERCVGRLRQIAKLVGREAEVTVG
ncbi:Ppx/GppA family phosphatase [Lichenibacterium dinghuense]|uniref:Ppx/GppA family phosphatase n=1 Tax=Lichenibacterium dinghuense TaxID=2895977 RepID=UPI001F3C1FC7|nr:Ppx/GppA phosphatase family protein [Lichenibacterium sp. 6Y81]